MLRICTRVSPVLLAFGLLACNDGAVSPDLENTAPPYDSRSDFHSEDDGTWVIGAGPLVTRHFELSGFTTVRAESAYHVEIRHGEATAIQISADSNVVDAVIVTVNEGVLRLGLDISSTSNLHLSAQITMPDLHGIQLSGISRAEVSGFRFDHELLMDISSVSKLHGALHTGDVTLALSGVGSIDLEGQCGDLSATASDASSFELGDFACNDGDVSLSGASHGTVNLSGILNSDTRDASVLRYVGSPTIGTISTSGVSRIERAN